MVFKAFDWKEVKRSIFLLLLCFFGMFLHSVLVRLAKRHMSVVCQHFQRASPLVSELREQSGPNGPLVSIGTIKTLNIGTPRPATVVVLNIKQFNFTMK